MRIGTGGARGGLGNPGRLNAHTPMGLGSARDGGISLFKDRHLQRFDDPARRTVFGPVEYSDPSCWSAQRAVVLPSLTTRTRPSSAIVSTMLG